MRVLSASPVTAALTLKLRHGLVSPLWLKDLPIRAGNGLNLPIRTTLIESVLSLDDLSRSITTSRQRIRHRPFTRLDSLTAQRIRFIRLAHLESKSISRVLNACLH